jgi:hypothetical protein
VRKAVEKTPHGKKKTKNSGTEEHPKPNPGFPFLRERMAVGIFFLPKTGSYRES